MGEMGNNNTSGLREEDNTTPGAQGKSLEEPFHNGEVKGENYAVPTTGSKDYNRKETGLASDDPTEAGEPPVDNQISDGTGLQFLNIKLKRNQMKKVATIEIFDVAVSLPMELEDHKNPTLSENVLEISNNQIESRVPSRKLREVKVVEDSDEQKEAPEENFEEFEGKIGMIHELGIIAGKSSLANGKINEEESGVNKTDEAYEEKIMFPELATVAAELPVTKNEEEAVDCKAEEDEAAEKQIVETKEKQKPCAPAEEAYVVYSSISIPIEHQQQETVKKSEDVQDSTESNIGTET
ncbi:hypothetical protein GH714_003893 [Hevea brasiliensis]|uniref:Uncharacterized protein n=1 Tax=Hevea brasiliensis TaxID=3981 RepID=A0A6A6KQH1_HEVBR|nr:hypothetical protein GH714_003893 [Hevea brasiliensis]